MYSIVGAFFEVYNYYGYGLAESVYAGAMAHELRARGHSAERELGVVVRYKGVGVARQRLDMVIDLRVIVEIKATEHLSPAASAQVISYLRATPFQVGVLLHFGPVAEHRRFVDSSKRGHLERAFDADLDLAHGQQERLTNRDERL